MQQNEILYEFSLSLFWYKKNCTIKTFYGWFVKVFRARKQDRLKGASLLSILKFNLADGKMFVPVHVQSFQLG